MFKLLKAIFHHAYLLITLRHDGKGLKTPILLSILFCLLNMWSYFINFEQTNDFNFLNILILCACYLFFYAISSIEGLNAMLLIYTTLNLIQFSFGITVSNPYSSIFTIWELLALFKISKTMMLNKQKK
jgi:hypothetical protein